MCCGFGYAGRPVPKLGVYHWIFRPLTRECRYVSVSRGTKNATSCPTFGYWAFTNHVNITANATNVTGPAMRARMPAEERPSTSRASAAAPVALLGTGWSGLTVDIRFVVARREP